MGDSTETAASAATGATAVTATAVTGGQVAAFGQALAAAVVAEAPEAIVVTAPDGTIALWNRGAERVFGYPAAQALGASLDLIIPEKLRAAHWAGFDKTMASGETRYGETLLKVPAAHADGRRLSIEFSVALLRDDDGKVTGICAVIRDATERWHADRARTAREQVLRASEEELRDRVAELERQLADRHDGPRD